MAFYGPGVSRVQGKCAKRGWKPPTIERNFFTKRHLEGEWTMHRSGRSRGHARIHRQEKRGLKKRLYSTRLTVLPKYALLIGPRNNKAGIHGKCPPACILFCTTVAHQPEEPEKDDLREGVPLDFGREPSLRRRGRRTLCSERRRARLAGWYVGIRASVSLLSSKAMRRQLPLAGIRHYALRMAVRQHGNISAPRERRARKHCCPERGLLKEEPGVEEEECVGG